jgi:hypothetical protein
MTAAFEIGQFSVRATLASCRGACALHSLCKALSEIANPEFGTVMHVLQAVRHCSRVLRKRSSVHLETAALLERMPDRSHCTFLSKALTSATA